MSFMMTSNYHLDQENIILNKKNLRINGALASNYNQIVSLNWHLSPYGFEYNFHLNGMYRNHRWDVSRFSWIYDDVRL